MPVEKVMVALLATVVVGRPVPVPDATITVVVLVVAGGVTVAVEEVELEGMGKEAPLSG